MKIDAIKLKLLAAESGMNVQELAEAAGVAFTTVVKARSGKKVSERTIVRLAKALHVEARELIDQE